MAVKNSQRFAEIERLMGDYFGCHLAPVMGRVQRDLSNRQADEMRAYSNSTAGIHSLNNSVVIWHTPISTTAWSN